MKGQWDNVTITIIRTQHPDPNGPCANVDIGNDVRRFALSHTSHYVKVYPSVCLESGRVYKVIMEFNRLNPTYDSPLASILIDSVSYVNCMI